ncbi:hypothetical protein Sme01_19440 [Sphaerisporangium melleum]|uniref:RDD domain-containing protein n=2 Tax=Sphaerisporangium melleum TaxID=321316 RepID=A0A917RF00_9ACTN|nr:hypothetical protein GCM10007964_51200 [Sphaerisporangium melleum]GII69468.1 hypothetical protein Sme01_19440 [Sphaerisporangium melleum]
MAAAAVAAFPTWEEWRFRLQPGEPEIRACFGGSMETSPLDPLRGDLDVLLRDVTAAAVPVLLVVVVFIACLGHKSARQEGRRAAGALALIAVLEPAVPAYGLPDPDDCGMITMLSPEWFATVLGSWGATQFCLLGAAALVLLAARITGIATAQRPAAGVTWRRVAALLVDYVILVVALPFVVALVLLVTGLDGSPSFATNWGLVNAMCVSPVSMDPDRLIALPMVLAYFWAQHSRQGWTLGKWLLRIRLAGAGEAKPGVGRVALRTLVFPGAVFVPVVGPFVLVIDVLWTFLDPDGRTLHDRLARTVVTPRVPSVKPLG